VQNRSSFDGISHKLKYPQFRLLTPSFSGKPVKATTRQGRKLASDAQAKSLTVRSAPGPACAGRNLGRSGALLTANALTTRCEAAGPWDRLPMVRATRPHSLPISPRPVFMLRINIVLVCSRWNLSPPGLPNLATGRPWSF
jgi:hypothetical protein